MEKRKTVKLVRQEMRALLRLSPWVLVSLLLAAVLWRTDIAAISGLFQSVQSPVATATTQPPTPIPTLVPTQMPTVLATEAPTVAPTSTQVVTPTATLPPTETATPVVAPASPTPLTSPTAEPDATVEGSERYPGEDTSLKFDWGMLFDSVALGVSYIWLCCGILLLVSVPIVFVILWVMSKRQQQQQQQEE
jgi:hypothetical protein